MSRTGSSAVGGDRKPLFALYAAEAISQIGNMMTIVAGPWFVLETTGSAAKTGIVSAALVLGSVLPAVAGGPIVDRLGYRRGSVLADLFSAATVALVPLLHAADVLAFWQLVALVFILSSFNSQGDTARFGLVPGLARHAYMTPEHANAVDRAVVRVGSLLGPLLGGFFIALLGAANVLLLDALTFTTSALIVAFGVPRSLGRISGRDESGEPVGGYWAELKEGLHYIGSHRVILWVVIVITIGNSLDKPLITVVAPVYAERIFGNPESLGLMVGAFGGGALLGTLAYGAIGRQWPRRRTFLTCFVVAPLIAFGVLALTPPLPVVVLAAFVSGLVAGPINPVFETVVQERTPAYMLGRVFGALQALAFVGIPIGAVAAGAAIEAAGLVPTIVAMGSLYVLLTSLMFLNPTLRQMDIRTSATPSADSGADDRAT